MSKGGVDVVADSARVLSTRSVTRLDGHVQFREVILQERCRPNDICKQIDKTFAFLNRACMLFVYFYIYVFCLYVFLDCSSLVLRCPISSSVLICPSVYY